jgi:hypothetical protein
MGRPKIYPNGPRNTPGKCRDCSLPSVEGKGFCSKHLERARIKSATNRIKNPTYQKQYYRNNVEAFKAYDAKRRPKGKAYLQHNVTEKKWLDKLEEQKYLCPICKEFLPENDRVTDHNHTCCPGNYSCGKCFRGILHGVCNAAIGGLKDNPIRAANAVEYLSKYGQ